MSAIRALRCVARSTPTFSTRAVTRCVAARPQVVKLIAPSFSARAFSVSRATFGQGQTDVSLSLKLQEEITYETEAAGTAEPDFLKEFNKTGLWTVEDKPGHDEITLIRKFGNETVRVLFSIADIDNSEQFEEEEGENTEGDHVGASFPIRCAVTVVKPNEGALTVECFAQEGSFTVENIAFYSDPSLAIETTADADWKRRGLYIGPQFDHLDAGVQEELEKYLQERGVDESLALFIPEYAEHKEQKEYVSWLKGVRKFIDA